MQGEEALKKAVYDMALPSQSIELGPAQKVLELLQSPFSDRKVFPHTPKTSQKTGILHSLLATFLSRTFLACMIDQGQ